jgi:phage replication initiation protein
VSLTTIDWLGYRSLDTPGACIEALRAAYGTDGGLIKVTPQKHGKKGYQRLNVLSLDDFVIGDMAFGGDSQLGWVWIEITGKGCQWVSDWNRCEDAISNLAHLEYKRVDIALDTFKREVTHEKVVQAHTDGHFKTGGKPPSMRQIIPSDLQDGRTIYVGKRTQPKFLRAYEKGYETVKKLPKPLTVDMIDGVPIADWYRLELELKNVNKPLPGDLIGRRDQYFAGAYPYLQSVLDVEPQVLKLSRDRGPQRALADMLEIIRAQYGSSIFTALTALGGDVGAVMDKIIGNKHNQRLLEEGVLLVDHT